MGYLTLYSVTITPEDQRDRIIAEIAKSEWKYLRYALGDELEQGEDYCRWYDSENDMRRLSKLFPEVIFDLYGEGEETLDAWHKYFKNGKMQEVKAKITFDEFDPYKLKGDEK